MAELSTPPDDKDWTWVLQRSCQECEFDAGALPLNHVPEALARGTRVVRDALVRDDATTRPDAQTWSPLEYACHVRDVHGVMTARLRLIQRGRR